MDLWTSRGYHPMSGIENRMPKVILEFSLPDENNALKLAQRGSDYYCIILEIRRLIRDFEKYDNSDQNKLNEYWYSVKRAVYEAQTEDIE